MDRQVGTLRGHSDRGNVAFSPDGKRVVSVSNTLHVKIWDAETGAEVCNHGGAFLARPEASVHSKD